MGLYYRKTNKSTETGNTGLNYSFMVQNTTIVESVN